MRKDLIVGSVVPDFELPDHLGQQRTLSALQAEHPYLHGSNPMILVLGRGHFCPKDQQQHRDLVAFYPKIAVAYTQIVTILPGSLSDVQDFREGVGAQWTFLCDAHRQVQRELELEEYTAPAHKPTIPHTFVLSPGLVVERIYNGYWFWGRPTTEELWQDLRAISARIRPDWDLGTPGLREAWDAGERARFYPYGERWWERPESARNSTT
jgi:peroxiredoxin